MAKIFYVLSLIPTGHGYSKTLERVGRFVLEVGPAHAAARIARAGFHSMIFAESFAYSRTNPYSQHARTQVTVRMRAGEFAGDLIGTTSPHSQAAHRIGEVGP